MNDYGKLKVRPNDLVPTWEVTDYSVSPRYWGRNGSAGFAPFIAALIPIGYMHQLALLTRREKMQASLFAAGNADLIFDFDRDVTLDLMREAERFIQLAKALCHSLVGNPLGAIPLKGMAQASASEVQLEINLGENPGCKVHGRVVDFGAKVRGQSLYLLAALAMTPGQPVTGAQLTERMAQLGHDGDGDTTLTLKVAKFRAMACLRAATQGTLINVDKMISSTRVNSLPALRLDWRRHRCASIAISCARARNVRARQICARHHPRRALRGFGLRCPLFKRRPVLRL